MTIKKNLALSVLALAAGVCMTSAHAQNSNPSNLTSSPYTRYGFGKLGSVGNASTRAMGDIGIALRTNMYTNLNNPASLTAIDTLTMLFDTALDTDWHTVSENGTRESDWNAGFSYLTFHFPLWNRFAGSIAYTPYSMVGFEYGNEEDIPTDHALLSADTLFTTNSYSGNGGLQHFQLAMAWNPIKTRTTQLNLGVKAGYICGAVDYAGSEYEANGKLQSLSTLRSYSCSGWDLDLGLQYTQQLVPEKSMTLGVTFSPRTHIGCDTEMPKISGKDTTLVKTSVSLSAPMKFGVGLSYQIDRKLTASAEYAFENWSKVSGLNSNLKQRDDLYQDIHRLSAGIEYRPKQYAQNYFQVCMYRAGFSVRNSYIKAFDKQKEMTATCGIGLPIGRRSLFNLSVAYTHLKPSSGVALKENYLQMTLGITFNEMMFYRSRLR